MATKKIQKEFSDSMNAPKKVRKKVAPKKSAIAETMVEDVPVKKVVKKKAARKKVTTKPKATTKPTATATSSKAPAKRAAAKKKTTKAPAKRAARSAASERARKATVDSIVRSIAVEEEAVFEQPDSGRIRGGDALTTRERRQKQNHAAKVHRAVVFAELYLLSTVITIFIVGAVTLLSLLFTITA